MPLKSTNDALRGAVKNNRMRFAMNGDGLELVKMEP